MPSHVPKGLSADLWWQLLWSIVSFCAPGRGLPPVVGPLGSAAYVFYGTFATPEPAVAKYHQLRDQALFDDINFNSLKMLTLEQNILLLWKRKIYRSPPGHTWVHIVGTLGYTLWAAMVMGMEWWFLFFSRQVFFCIQTWSCPLPSICFMLYVSKT